MTLARLRDWRSRLVAFANAARGRPFAWGETDCLALVRGALVAMFGEEADARLPRWSSRTEALRLAAVASPAVHLRRLGAVEVPLAFRRTGDLVWAPVADDPEHLEGFGVVVPPGVLVGLPERGATLAPLVGLPTVPRCLRVERLTFAEGAADVG